MVSGAAARVGPCLVVTWVLAGTAVARDGGPASPLRFDVERFDPRAVQVATENGEPVELTYFGTTHQLLLHPSSVRSERLRVATGSLAGLRRTYLDAPTTFQGRLVGDPESQVRMSTSARGIRGYIRSRDGWTFIEPLHQDAAAAQLAAAAGAPEHKVFTEGDLDMSFLGECAEPVLLDASPQGSSEPAATAREPRTAAAELRVLEVAIDADVEFEGIHGANAATEIEGVINMLDGIFETELSLSIEIVSIHVWDAEPDPYTSTDSATLLGELRTHWNANNGGISRDAVHLFTGKDLNGSTVGIAYVSVVCSTSVAYGLSQDLGSDALMPLLVGHEMGHNLGANHDPSTSTTRYIMYPSLGFSTLDQFSDQSKNEIGSYVDSVSCLALESSTPGGGPTPPGGGGNGGGGGGGGGGPVDPLLLFVLGGAATAHVWKRKASHHG